MDHVTGSNREQIKMISLDQMVDPKSPVRIIDAFVNALDLKKYDFLFFNLKPEGRPPFHPAVMMKLYLYGYQNGITTCRKLAKACINNIEVMWLVEERRPAWRTIAKFRANNHKAFQEVFRDFVAMLRKWKLVDGKTVAIDSFKIRASNSLKNNHNIRKIKRHQRYIEEQLKEYEKELDKETVPENKKMIKKKIAKQKTNKKKYKKLEEQLDESNEAQISTTDPDSRAVFFQRTSVKVGYNIQAASDKKHKLLIAADTGDVNDTKALSPMAQMVQQNVNRKNINVLADKGYHSGREFKACEKMGITTFVSPKASSSSKKNPAFASDAFDYNEKQDSYTCPAGQQLNTNGNWYNKSLKNGRKSYQVKHYKAKACDGCSLRTQCTKNKLGRIIERTEYAQYVKENNHRVTKNPDYYKLRQQIIEHQFGTLKRHWFYDHTNVRGKEKVLGEANLVFTAYNLKRCVQILGFDGILKKLKAKIRLYIQIHFSSVLEWIRFRKEMSRHCGLVTLIHPISL